VPFNKGLSDKKDQTGIDLGDNRAKQREQCVQRLEEWSGFNVLEKWKEH
jgi:hypothetical protein